MEKSTDICLVVEGSYPYVTGGVSSWLQWLMTNMRNYTFSIVSLIAENKSESDRKYSFPANVIDYREYVIFDYEEITTANPLHLSSQKWMALSGKIHILMDDWHSGTLSDQSLSFLKDIISTLSPGIFRNFMEDEAAFAVMTRIYEKYRGDAGFVKYFYNFRNIHLIFFRLLTLVARLPEAKVYHSPGTGYAGLIACLRSALFNGRSILTEHGIYLQEREMELLKSDWLDDPYLKDMWIDSFGAICRWQYEFADRIITLYQGNKQLELEYGAAAERIRVVPNGIDVERFKETRSTRCTGDHRLLGIVGRVDSVKDIKTFIQAMAILAKDRGQTRGLIIGPTDDQPDYYKECLQLVTMLGLSDVITFTGQANVLDYYVKLDLLMLTSIKEAMPLVVMEGMASGIPVVATDVGACRELIYGVNDGIGPAGTVVRVMDAEGLAEAAIRILESRRIANEYAENGIQRIEKFYREDIVIGQYQKIYEEEIHAGHHLPS